MLMLHLRQKVDQSNAEEHARAIKQSSYLLFLLSSPHQIQSKVPLHQRALHSATCYSAVIPRVIFNNNCNF